MATQKHSVEVPQAVAGTCKPVTPQQRCPRVPAAKEGSFKMRTEWAVHAVGEEVWPAGGLALASLAKMNRNTCA